MPAGTVVVTPKPLAPRPCHTDPPLHSDTTVPILPTATTMPLAYPQVAPAPIVPRRSARLAVLGTGASKPATTVLLTTLPDSQVPQSYWEAMTQPELWRPAMEMEWDVLRDRGIFQLVDAPPDMHVINSMWVFANKY